MSEEIKNVAEEAQVEAPVAEETKIEAAPAKKAALNASVAPEDFDWDAFENEGVESGSKEETLAKYEQTLSKVTENEVVEGVVTSINKREVVVNIGAKSEGVISATEFRYNPDLKVGDKVEVLVENAEDSKGQLVISHKK
ncbi:MAG: S1 RNA-binding domain-containing protein, partial [Bacteroidales bacterium]|nr:S1 RNA-binding domain-containing protein [Bacteroidales bacterium]